MSTVPTELYRRNAASHGRPVNLAHLVLTLNTGGLEKVVYDLVRFSDREQFSMRVLCLEAIGDLRAAFAEAGVPVENLGVHAKGPVHCVRAVARRLRELRLDVLHTHNAAPHIVGASAARLSGVPVVVHTRHGMHRIRGWRNTLGNRLAARLTHRMVAVSGATAGTARDVDRIPESRLEIIRNGIDLERYRPRSWRPGAPVRKAIHVARLDDSTKDQRTLLRALRLVVDRQPQFRLDIVGDGPDRAAVETLCDALNLRGNVTFLGLRDDVHALLPHADLFLLSSVTEGLPMTLLEAMASGLPIVSTDVGGISEVVARGTTGLLVPAQSPDRLADAILELACDPGRAAQMGIAGRRRVEEEFDVRVVTARYEQLYRTLLREHSPRPADRSLLPVQTGVERTS